jgi:hypothetical protein
VRRNYRQGLIPAKPFIDIAKESTGATTRVPRVEEAVVGANVRYKRGRATIMQFYANMCFSCTLLITRLFVQHWS